MARPPLVVFVTGPESDRLAGVPCRWWRRLVARLLAPLLDRRLALGDPAESGWLMATRARMLVSPRQRQMLARRYQDLLARSGPSPRRPGRVPVDRRAIAACEGAVRQVIEALGGPAPVAARGVATAARLLGDGAGPLYAVDRRQDGGRLDLALLWILAQLDPGLPLALAGTAKSAGQLSTGNRSR
jgi:hypothetical protein